jgi:endonuclease YncB( thermonuclease family)
MAVMNLERSAFPAMAFACAAAVTASAAPAQRDCDGASAGPAAAARIIDGRSLVLADGREVRLAAIETVLAVPGDEDEPRVAAAQAAKAMLKALVLDREVDIAVTTAGADRYGRLTAYVFVRNESGEVLVQQELLAAGHAVVSPAPASPCRAALQVVEREARARSLGLWGGPYSVVKQASDPDDILADQGRFALVQGKVASVRESGGVVYINFGRRRSAQFTATLLKRNEGSFVALKTLAGHMVEVRGFIEERGGPAVEITRPEQIDIIH